MGRGADGWGRTRTLGTGRGRFALPPDASAYARLLGCKHVGHERLEKGVEGWSRARAGGTRRGLQARTHGTRRGLFAHTWL
jgi:hypothetical protein